MTPAQAETPDQKAVAQALFEQGRDLVLQKNYAEACPKLLQSLRLDPGTGTMLWLADCYEKNGQNASAWARFKEAAAMAAMAQDPREKVARRRAADLEPRLAKLTISVPPEANVAGIEVRRDGLVVAAAELGTPTPLDPGIHTLSASANAREPWSITVDLPAKGDVVTVNVPVLVPVAVAAPLGARAAPSPSPLVAASAPSSTARIFGLSLAGLGVVALGTGAFLGLRAGAVYDSSNEDGHCARTNECDAIGKERRADAGALATGSTVAFTAGIAALAGGAILYFTAPRQRKTALTVVPVTAGRDVGLILQRAW
jgi:serine/threonine-protein kinase